MDYIIAVFNSRNAVLKCYQVLSSVGFTTSVISTPRVKGLSCGICVKIKKEDYHMIKKTLSQYDIPNFSGFYQIKKENENLVAIKL